MFWTFVDPGQLEAGRVVIDGRQGHHLARVLRVRPGERGVAVANQREYQVEVADVRNGRVVGRLLSDRPVTGEPERAITLLQAMLPNPDFDAVIEGTTAVGIRRIIAVQAERSVARPGSSRLDRWRAIAESAAEQSHRGTIPEVIGPVPLNPALDQVRGSRLLVLEPGASTPIRDVVDDTRACALAVGPEGGWTDDELVAMRQQRAMSVSLGPRILRARLAPIVATAILVQQQ